MGPTSSAIPERLTLRCAHKPAANVLLFSSVVENADIHARTKRMPGTLPTGQRSPDSPKPDAGHTLRTRAETALPSLLPFLVSAHAVEPEPPPEPVRAQIDWQGHPAMHLTWPILFRAGLTDRAPSRTYEHQFHQIAFTPYLDDSGVRIHLFAAMSAERARNPEQARDMIERELQYVEDWVDANSDRYAMAYDAAQAREILATTSKAVVIHSIEGGRELLRHPSNATYWRERGVALVTVTHLLDDELGGAALNPGFTGRLTNPAAVRKRRRGEDRGLTDRGRQVIVELADAGILVDLSHMSPQSVDETLAITREHGIPPVVTHGKLARIQEGERSFTDDQVVEIYRQGGTFNLVLAGNALLPNVPGVALPDDYCPGTMDDFRIHWNALQAILDENLDALVGVDTRSALTTEQQIRLSTGWASDWNGWTRHSAPIYGRGRCRPRSALPDPALPIDTMGIAHPGVLPGHWQRLEEAGVALEPMMLSAERFLQLWAEVDARR
jgi:microsomal dipeptidase-like Zn-dependent dipeptidase